jgi:hypothetical protein
MYPSTRDRLRKAWGLCERHAWGFISVDAAFRGGYLHGPAVLYEDLMDRAFTAMDVNALLSPVRMLRKLREKEPCTMCEGRYGPDTKGAINEDRVKKGRDLTELRLLARRAGPYWRPTICGRCAGTDAVQRCRRHLMEDIAMDLVDNFDEHRRLVTGIAHRLSIYAQSFQVEFRHTRTDEDMAALISAVGWCSGWSVFLSIMR